MIITSVIYWIFIATLFLLKSIVCLYRDCIDSQTKPTLIACKLLSASEFMKQLILPHAAVLKPVQAQKAYLQPDTIAVHKWVVLSVNRTDILALWVYAVFRRS